MANYELNAVHAANHYLWSKMQSELGLSTANYNGLVPITVAQQQPEFTAFNKPFLVYSYTVDPIGTSSWDKSETCAYSIFSADEADIRKIINLMVSLFKDYDESADRLNTYVSGLDDRYKVFDFKYTRIGSASGSQPAEQEGGRMDGLVIVNYTYTTWDTDPESAGYGTEVP
jgi:hypothetical protein